MISVSYTHRTFQGGKEDDCAPTEWREKMAPNVAAEDKMQD